VAAGLIQKLLPILAPIVMAYLAKQLTGPRRTSGRTAASAACWAASSAGCWAAARRPRSSGSSRAGPDLGSILGGLLGGGTR
jgi:hypothetical protein